MPSGTCSAGEVFVKLCTCSNRRCWGMLDIISLTGLNRPLSLSLSLVYQLYPFTHKDSHTHNGTHTQWNTKPSYLEQNQGPLFQPTRRSFPFPNVSSTSIFQRPMRCLFVPEPSSLNRVSRLQPWSNANLKVICLKACVTVNLHHLCVTVSLHAHCSAQCKITKKKKKKKKKKKAGAVW